MGQIFPSSPRDFFKGVLHSLPGELAYVGNEAYYHATGEPLIDRSLIPSFDDVLLSGLKDVSLISISLAICTGNLPQLGMSVGSLVVCAQGLIQRRSIRELTSIVKDLKEANETLQDITSELEETNKGLKQTKVELEETKNELEETNKDLQESKDELKDEISRLNDEISQLEDVISTLEEVSGDIKSLTEKHKLSQEKLDEANAKLESKLKLLESISDHINEQCQKLAKHRTDLEKDSKSLVSSLTEKIDDLKTVISTLQNLAKA